MTPTTTFARPAPTLPLDVLHADLTAINTAIISLRHHIARSGGRAPFELSRYLDSAVARRAEVVAEIAAVEAGR